MPKVSKKDPNKPKGVKSAYNFFLQDQKVQMKGEGGESLSLQEFSRSCAEKWKNMSEEEKKPYTDKAEEDKTRYMKEMSSYSPPQEEQNSAKKIRKKKVKDPNKPKKNLSAYMYFLAEKRASVKEDLTNPSAGAILKVLGDMWSKTSDSDKVKYQDLAKKDRQRYEEEMKAYQNKNQALSSGNKKAVALENGTTED